MSKQKKLKILELTNYSAGVCGVWARVLAESKLLSKNHEVLVMSSNAVKGSDETAKPEEKIEKTLVKRFPFKKLGGESFMSWLNKTAKSEAIKFNPDIIMAHSYRHPHTITALKVAKKTNSKAFLVTHAPFGDNSERNLLSKLIIKLYDFFIAPRTLNKFDKILAITNWELPSLEALKVKKDKIIHLPNGIPNEFFKLPKLAKETNKILFLGRISPIKNLETLLRSIPLIKDKQIKLEIVGPAEEPYLTKLNELISSLNLQNRVIFSPPIYNIKEKIAKIDSAKVFVLPSIREGMPQSLIEAMARGKMVIASDNPGSKDLIQDNLNGFIFETQSPKDLAEKINLALLPRNSKIKKASKESVKKFSWDKVINDLETLLEKITS